MRYFIFKPYVTIFIIVLIDMFPRLGQKAFISLSSFAGGFASCAIFMKSSKNIEASYRITEKSEKAQRTEEFTIKTNLEIEGNLNGIKMILTYSLHLLILRLRDIFRVKY